MRIKGIWFIVFALPLSFVSSGGEQAPAQNPASERAGTLWQLVKFRGSDGQTLTPDDKTRYAVAFATDGGVSVRIDCNRGQGTWNSLGHNQVGPLALTRAMCLPAPLNDHITKQWTYVRSYTFEDGPLYLSLIADGGTYEFEPMSAGVSGKVRGTATYRERIALPTNAVFEATLEDVSRADAPAEVIARARIEGPGNPPIPFEISFEPAKIEQDHGYAVRARITDGTRLIFTTMQSYPVLTRGNGSEVNILLQRAEGSVAKSSSSNDSGLAVLPASFIGTIPCADCPGIRYQVNLLPDHTFTSRMSYEERNTSFDDHGQWQLASDGKTLVLHSQRRAAEKFVVHGDALRKLDAEGHEIESKFNYDLHRAPEFEGIESQSQASTGVSLEKTYWKLAALGDAPITAASQQQEAHFILNSGTHRVSGAGGCNRLMGSYQLDGSQLTFSHMAGTMMACVKGMDTEKAFLNTLMQVKTWKIHGQQLELFDAEGKPVARFSAVYMK